MEIVTGEPAPMVPPAQAAALLGEMAAVVRTIFAVHAPARPDLVPDIAPVPTAPSPVAAVPSPVPLAAIPLPELDELAFLD